jgi:hypothetical protein
LPTVQRQWFTSCQLTPGAVVFEWHRAFALWGFTGSHSVLLFRSVKGATRIDLAAAVTQRGRHLFLAMLRIDGHGEPTRPNGFRCERWVDVVPITL